MTNCFQTIIAASMPILGIVTLVGLVVNFLLVGPMFSLQALKPDLKKLDPIKGLQQKFKLKTLVELIKSLLKIGVATYLIYSEVWDSIDTVNSTVALPVVSSAYIVADFLRRVVIKVGIFFLFVGVVDLAYQKRNFAKEMRMEKFEVKQEYKDTEGNPEIKGKRRQIAQEIAYEEGPAVARRAKAVISNPTHIAVAIGYEPEKYPAPYILTMGIAEQALTIIRIAEKAGVPIMRDPPLARELFENGEINRYIPEETYEAVAEILRFVILMQENPEHNE